MLLTDETRDPRRLPTRKNMIDAMYWLVNGAKMDDSLFFHCTDDHFFRRDAERLDLLQFRDTALRFGMKMETKWMAMTRVRVTDSVVRIPAEISRQ
jgi:hypothetical protein